MKARQKEIVRCTKKWLFTSSVVFLEYRFWDRLSNIIIIHLVGLVRRQAEIIYGDRRKDVKGNLSTIVKSVVVKADLDILISLEMNVMMSTFEDLGPSAISYSPGSQIFSGLYANFIVVCKTKMIFLLILILSLKRNQKKMSTYECYRCNVEGDFFDLSKCNYCHKLTCPTHTTQLMHDPTYECIGKREQGPLSWNACDVHSGWACPSCFGPDMCHPPSRIPSM